VNNFLVNNIDFKLPFRSQNEAEIGSAGEQPILGIILTGEKVIDRRE